MADLVLLAGTVITMETELDAASLAERIAAAEVDDAFGSFTTEADAAKTANAARKAREDGRLKE